MNTRYVGLRSIIACFVGLVLHQTSLRADQATLSAVSHIQVVRYVNSSGGYSYTNGLHSIGRLNGSNPVNSASTEDIYRTYVEFDVGGYSTAVITQATLYIAVLYNNSSYTASVTGPSEASLSNLQQVWSNVGSGSVYFSGIPYDGASHEYTSAAFTDAANASLASGKFRIGFVSSSEATNGTQAMVDYVLVLRYEYLRSITVRNSFDAGTVNVDGRTYSSGNVFRFVNNSTHTLEAIDGQNYLNYVRRFQNWSTGHTTPSITIYVTADATYTANFAREFDITFQNNLPGASGGQIKVNGSTYSAPHVALTLDQTPPQGITGEALYQVISGIEYTFSSWSPGGSTSASTTFYPDNHTTYTASFSAKPQPPPGVSAGGSVGSYVQVTWSEHPHQQVTQYQIWRKVKQQGDVPVLLTTVNRGTTSYTDYGYKITDGYTHDLVSYDVRSYFSVNASYSDPNWVPVFARQDISAERGVGEAEQAADLAAVPMEYSLGSYPNPFNPSTTIRYTLLQNARVQVGIFDLMGREITRLVDTEKNAGMYQVVWHGVDERGEILPSGIYLVRMSAESTNGRERFAKTMKIVMMK